MTVPVYKTLISYLPLCSDWFSFQQINPVLSLDIFQNSQPLLKTQPSLHSTQFQRITVLQLWE